MLASIEKGCHEYDEYMKLEAKESQPTTLVASHANHTLTT